MRYRRCEPAPGVQRLVLAAEAGEHDAEAVVTDRDVAGPVGRLEHGARVAEADQRGLELAGLRERDADLAIAPGCGALVTDRQVFLTVTFELFDAAENVWHNGALLHLTMADTSRDFKTIP